MWANFLAVAVDKTDGFNRVHEQPQTLAFLQYISACWAAVLLGRRGICSSGPESSVNPREKKQLVTPHPYCVFPQGMASDLKRAEPSSEASDRVSPNDPDLVAYWTFEEGSGYLVKDVTANKHDLHIQQPPHWRVSCLHMDSRPKQRACIRVYKQSMHNPLVICCQRPQH